jgi:hypothetical protein
MAIDKKAFGLSDSLVNAVNEALKGGQKKLDKNHNGKLDGQDFAILRGTTKAKVKPQYDKARPAFKEDSKEQQSANEQSSSDYEKANYKHDLMMLGKDKKKMDEAAPAASGVADQMADKKSALQAQIQRKIAQKQMDVMKAKANKRISSIKEGEKKCTCGEGKGSKMSCEVCSPEKKSTKGGKEAIVMNPPLKEASDLPKKVITKGHEIAKSLIKHRSKVKSPYAVGMATAKKSAGIKEDSELDEGNPLNKQKKNAAAAAVGAKNRDDNYLNKMNPDVADKIRGREKMSGADRKQYK